MTGIAASIGLGLCFLGWLFYWGVNKFMYEKYYDTWHAIKYFDLGLRLSNYLFDRGIKDWRNDLITRVILLVFNSLYFIIIFGGPILFFVLAYLSGGPIENFLRAQFLN